MSDENVPTADQVADPEPGNRAGEPEAASGGASAAAGPAEEATAGSGGEEWRAVVAELNALGDAISRWVKAAVADEDNKRRAAEFRERLDGFATKVGEVAKDATDSDVGRSFKEAADKTGEAFKQAGEKISDEAAPKAATAFRGFADKLREAAERLEKQAVEKGENQSSPETQDASSEATDDSTPDA